jgi:hypothetical protein
MSRITIRNRAEPQWQPVIETKLQVMLGSMLAHISRIEVEFDRIVEARDQRVTYTCQLVLTESSGERYQLCNDQPDANLAIEGAIARARRSITRLGRARVPTWRQASAR